ncbi:ABC transporter substrate-binding protein [Celeribacter indicus]|uniref:Extracellular solute-binding protein, ABC transporter n=1 Tax=Celeribacter indicus TaxID=1208324 RepID=A0A0B5DVL0_9RHOB|nr:substrate-binding domain-containing protein [Celeribacter indicus]AJE44796.1 Extracellular solute-binding protein, ABC transporter [Celeribacter indicus]SDX47161.1 putative spermidine/putrescine transport system substrate-binding protein [Celeribacter indicus]
MQRRQFLKASAATMAALSAPSVLRAATDRLRVGTYGGYFQESFDEYIYPDFTAATGIEIESIAEPTGEAWLVQLSQAARAGQAPADVSMMAQLARIKGERSGLWAPLDDSAMGNLSNLPDHFVHRYEDGGLYGTGAVSWYITLVTNTDAYPDAPGSWTALWDPANADKLGLMSMATNSFLLEITATTHFGGTEILTTDDGVLQVMDKLAEVKPNVRLWYRDEGQFQQALETGEIPMGQYYHDVTGLAASQGKPVRSTFPEEGAVLDSGSWVVSKASKAIEPAQVFIDYMAQAEIQSKLSRFVGTAPTVPRELTDLTDEEFAAVSSDATPILPMSEIYVDRGDWINQMWSERITG